MDIYTHITNLMRSKAAAKIDQRIGKAAPQALPAESQEKRTITTFQPNVGSPAPAVSLRSARTAGRGATPLFGRTVRRTPEMCTPTPTRNVRRNSRC